ncbi:MAG: hypothetical protein QM783_04000 [Phycisphaerales bacterium]
MNWSKARTHTVAEPVAGSQPALPDYTLWATGQRECWLSAATSVQLRRVGEKFAAIVSTNQGGGFITVCAEAEMKDGRITFDRWVPWGPCREAVVHVRDKQLFLAPVTSLAGAQMHGVDIKATALSLYAPPRIVEKVPAKEQERWAAMYLDAFRALAGVQDAATDQSGLVAYRDRTGERLLALPPDLAGSESAAAAAAEQEAQIRRIAEAQKQKLPSAPATVGDAFSPAGTWKSADGNSVLRIESNGGNSFRVLELTDSRPRFLRTSDGVFERGMLTTKVPLITHGATVFYPARIGDKQVLVAGSSRTLDAWNRDSTGRAKLTGVWKRVAEPDPPADKHPQ